LKKYILLVLLSFSFSGCWFSLGMGKGLCESGGCNYKEAGVCSDVIDIYKNRSSLKNYKE
jgi:hypothetical protein